MKPEEYYTAKTIVQTYEDDDPKDQLVINANQYIYVYLTDKGKDFLFNMEKTKYGKPVTMPTIFGQYKFQIYRFMQIFGSAEKINDYVNLDFCFHKKSITKKNENT